MDESPPTKPRGRKRRIAKRLLVATVALLVLAIASFALVLYSANAEFAAGALSRLTGRRVEIGQVSISFGWRLGVELVDVRVAESAESGGAPLLEVERAAGSQPWPMLLAGQLLPLDWSLERPVLRLRARDPSEGPSEFSLRDLPRLGLTVVDGAIEWQPREGEPWRIHGLMLDGRRGALGTRVTGDATGRIARGARNVSEFQLSFVGKRDGIDAKGTVAAFDLSSLPESIATARGDVGGRFEIGLHDGQVRGKLDLVARGLSLHRPELNAPIEPAKTEIAADFTWQAGAISLDFRPLVLDALVARGKLNIDPRPNGRFQVDVRFEPFEPGERVKMQPLALLGRRVPLWARVVTEIETGTVEDAHFVLDVPYAQLGEKLGFEIPPAPEEFLVELRARDGIYRPNADTRLEEMGGELEIRGNVMEIRKLHFVEGGEPVPELHVRIDGVHRLAHLPENEDRVHGGPGEPLEGLEAFFEDLSEDSEIPEAERPPRVERGLRFADLELEYPAFVLPLREASGELRFGNRKITAVGVRGVLGGVPADIDLHWIRDDRSVRVDVRFLEGAAPGAPTPGGEWLSADLALDSLPLGDWQVDSARGHVSATGSKLALTELEAKLAGGSVTGVGELELSEEGRAPYRFALTVLDADAAPLSLNVGLQHGSVTGVASAKGTLAGAFTPRARFLADADVRADVRLVKGSLGNLPATLVLARLPSLSGVMGILGAPLPYDELTGEIHIADGRLAVRGVKLMGPQLRVLADGEIDLAAETKPTDMVLALLFLRTLDRVLEQLPIVRNVMLGKDENLIGLYFRVSGPWKDPTAVPLAPELIRRGLQLPSRIVRESVRRLGNLIPDGREKSESNGSEAPAP